MKALIIGAGIGGLSAAIALGKIGVECRLIEQGDLSEPRGAGAGLSLWSNAVRVLRELGVEERAVAAGSVIERMVTIDRHGRTLAKTDVAAIGRDAGAVSLCIRRADLRHILLGALPAKVIRNGVRCVSFAARGDTVIAHMADGSTVDADMLIGADGIQSAVRAQLLGDEAPRYAGYTCWRGVAPGDGLPPGTAYLATGNGAQAGLFPCGSGRVYWFATCNAPAKAELAISGQLERWPDRVRQAIRATPGEAILRNDVVDRPPSSRWGRGRCTLLGDAAHPATPNLGQGACQALEDARAIAACLGNARPLSDCLRAYERARMARTAKVGNQSRRIGQFLQHENPFVMAARDALVRTPLARRMAETTLRGLLCPARGTIC